jgi:hypothetical protein
VNVSEKEEQMQDFTCRKVESYGAIKWLREKQLRERLEKELFEKVHEEMQKINVSELNKMKE